MFVLRHVFSQTCQHHTLVIHNNTSSPGCSSCRIRRMSGQFCVLEQVVGVTGLGGPSVKADVSLRTGKKVRWSQSTPSSSLSSLASAPTSHRISGSIKR